MTVKALMPVRNLNLVVPLAHEATAMRTTETAAPVQARPGAVTGLIGASLRPGDVDRTTVARTRGTRTSTTATRTTTTRAMRAEPSPSADPDLFEQLVASALERTAAAPAAELWQTANSYFGLLRQASHSHADRARLANVVRSRGKAVAASLTKTYPGEAAR